MANYARIKNGTAIDVSAEPEAQFHPDIVAQFEPVPDTVERGWRVDDAGAWAAPPAPEIATPDPVPVPLAYPRFLALVRQAGGLSADVALSIVDGTHASAEVRFLRALLLEATGPLERDDPLVQGGLDTLLAEGVLTQSGRDAIMAAWPTA